MRILRFLRSTGALIAKKIMPWIVFICLAAAMLFHPDRNTLAIASAAFAVSLALASVTFSYARTLKDGSALRDELVFGGERLVTGAVLFLVASIMNYASNDVPRYANILLHAVSRPEKPPLDVTFFGKDPIGLIIVFAAFMIFLIGLIYVQMGIVILTGITGYRAKRRPGHTDFFIATKTYEQHLTDLDLKGSGGVVAGQKSSAVILPPPHERSGTLGDGHGAGVS